MGMRDTYRAMILERVQKTAGFSFDQANIPARQWKRITALSELLHETLILEQMIRVEKVQSRSFSSRVSSRLRPTRAAELEMSVESLEKVKGEIWARCEDIAYDILMEKEGPDAGFDAQAMPGKSEVMRCRSCSGIVTIIDYNNFRCDSCGLGYSARDFLELMRKDIREI